MTAAGTYRFVAAYSGDANNAAGHHRLQRRQRDRGRSSGDADHRHAWRSGTVAAGGAISDTATLSGGVNPTGTITFTLFGPNNATCTGTRHLHLDRGGHAGNGSYPSGPFTTAQPAPTAGSRPTAATPTTPGHHRAATTPTRRSSSRRAGPAIVTQASAPVTVGGTINDTATLSGGHRPDRHHHLHVFGPNNGTAPAPRRSPRR